MPQAAGSPRWTHGPARFYAVAAVFVAIVVVVLWVAYEQARVLSQVRAYANGEALYSKAQKNAVISLLRYARTRSEADFARYLREIQVPLGDRDARLSLLRNDPYFAAAVRGFVRGRNHPDDARGMAQFFARFQGISYVAEAIRAWTAGDAEVARIAGLAAELRAAIADGADGEIERLSRAIVEVDARLTVLEDRFSATLGEGARVLVGATQALILAVAVALLGAGLAFAGRIARATARTERALRQSEARYRVLSESMADGILILQDARFVHANPAALRLVGYSLEELRGREFVHLIHPRHREMVLERHRRRIAGEAFQDQYDIEAITRAGESVWVRIANARLDDWDGRPAVLTIISDIRERKSAEEAVRRLNESLEERVGARTAELRSAFEEMESFSYSISHDLRAPLRAISSFTEILRREHAAEFGARAQHLLERISGNALAMAQLVDGLLEFARLGRQPLTLESVDMGALARSVLAELGADGSADRVEISVGPLPGARADGRVLRQVWVNLISNALKFTATKPSARVTIAGETRANEAVYRVSDNGVGFDMDYASKLFGVFQRLHGVEEFPGTGIGLALVRRIVERHGGRVWAEARPGEGATFHFSLPAAAAPERLESAGN